MYVNPLWCWCKNLLILRNGLFCDTVCCQMNTQFFSSLGRKIAVLNLHFLWNYNLNFKDEPKNSVRMMWVTTSISSRNFWLPLFCLFSKHHLGKKRKGGKNSRNIIGERPKKLLKFLFPSILDYCLFFSSHKVEELSTSRTVVTFVRTVYILKRQNLWWHFEIVLRLDVV